MQQLIATYAAIFATTSLSGCSFRLLNVVPISCWLLAGSPTFHTAFLDLVTRLFFARERETWIETAENGLAMWECVWTKIWFMCVSHDDTVVVQCCWVCNYIPVQGWDIARLCIDNDPRYHQCCEQISVGFAHVEMVVSWQNLHGVKLFRNI